MIVDTIKVLPYSEFYLRGPNFCEVLMSSQILILKQLFSFSFSTVNALSIIIQSFKYHIKYTYCMCPTTTGCRAFACM